MITRNISMLYSNVDGEDPKGRGIKKRLGCVIRLID